MHGGVSLFLMQLSRYLMSLVCTLYGWTRLLRIQANWFRNNRIWFVECFLPLDWCLQFWSSVHLIDLIPQCCYNGETERLNLHAVNQRSTLHKHHLGRQNLACCETLSKLLQRCFTRSLMLTEMSSWPYFENFFLQCSLFGSKNVTSISPMHLALSDGNQSNWILFGLYSSIVRGLVGHSSTEKENSTDPAWSLSELII